MSSPGQKKSGLFPELVLVTSRSSSSAPSPAPGLACPAHAPLLPPPSPLRGAQLIHQRQTKRPATFTRLTLGASQVVVGFVQCACGVAALVGDAPLAWVGGGVWAGLLLLAAGLLALAGAIGGRTNAQSEGAGHILAQLLAGTMALAASSLALVFSGAALARTDSSTGDGTRQQQQQQQRALQCGLLAMAVLGCVISLGSLALCLRDACASSGWGLAPRRRHLTLLMAPPKRRRRPFSQMGPTATGQRKTPKKSLGHVSSQDMNASCNNTTISTIMNNNNDKVMNSGGTSTTKSVRSQEKMKEVTEEEVASTYTGLDRILAEEFITSSMVRELPYDAF